MGTAIHIAGLSILFITGNFSAVTLAGMTSVSEVSILAYRMFIVYKNRGLIKGDVAQ